MANEALAPLLILLMVLALVLVILGFRRNQQSEAIEERLSQYGHFQFNSIEDIELRQPFQDRIVWPFLRRLSALPRRFTPRRAIEDIRNDLLHAGSPPKIGATEYLGIRVVMMLVLGVGLFGFMLLSNTGGFQLFGLPLFTAMIGYMLPRYWLKSKISARQKEIQKALPDAIDMLAISVESGLGFDPALARVVEKWNNALTEEMGRMLYEIRIGSSRREALREFAFRTGVDDVSVFVSSIVQADTLGVSISQVLRVQSQQMRQRRRQRAEKLAHEAPIKIIFPMVLFIFPALYIVLLGPAIPQILEGFGGL